MKKLRHTALTLPIQALITGKQEGCPVSQSTLGFTFSLLGHLTMTIPLIWLSSLLDFRILEIVAEYCPNLYSQSLAQSRCSLNLKWNEIDSSCKDNRLWVFNTKVYQLRRWLPRSEGCRARHHLTWKGLSQTGTKYRQEQCRLDNQKKKTPTQNYSLSHTSGRSSIEAQCGWSGSCFQNISAWYACLSNTVMSNELQKKIIILKKFLCHFHGLELKSFMGYC